MEAWMALVVGALYAAGLYLLLRRSLVKLVLGLALLGHAANLLIFTAGRIGRAAAPIVPGGASGLEPPYADPVPQALVLTAIVIGFGVQAFAVVLLRQTYARTRTDDLDVLDTTER
jgi:multicomponent Na+:H+ antiporter subunit C